MACQQLHTADGAQLCKVVATNWVYSAIAESILHKLCAMHHDKLICAYLQAAAVSCVSLTSVVHKQISGSSCSYAGQEAEAYA